MLLQNHGVPQPVRLRQYLITYDLHKVRNYAALYAALGTWRALRLCESVWLANLRGPAETVRDVLARTVDQDDTVAVIELQRGTDWATVQANHAANVWLSSNVTVSKLAA